MNLQLRNDLFCLNELKINSEFDTWIAKSTFILTSSFAWTSAFTVCGSSFACYSILIRLLSVPLDPSG